jgi:hypothetical protein
MRIARPLLAALAVAPVSLGAQGASARAHGGHVLNGRIEAVSPTYDHRWDRADAGWGGRDRGRGGRIVIVRPGDRIVVAPPRIPPGQIVRARVHDRNERRRWERDRDRWHDRWDRRDRGRYDTRGRIVITR